MSTGKPVRALVGHIGWDVRSVHFSNEGHFLASGGADGSVRIWELETGKQLRIWIQEDLFVEDICFSPTGAFLAIAGSDENVRIWKFLEDNEPWILRGHLNQVRGVGYSSDGCLLASSSTDGTIRIWNVPSGELAQILVMQNDFEGSNISHVQGLSADQITILKARGAIDTG